MNVNRVLLAGNLTRDPEMRYTPGGAACCSFGLAVNEKFKGKDGQQRESVLFVDCVTWNKSAEIAEQYLAKGRPVFIEGRLKLEMWDDKQTGAKRSKLSVIVDRLQFLPSGDRNTEQPQAQTQRTAPAPRARTAQAQAARPTQSTQAAQQVADDEIPEESIPF